MATNRRQFADFKAERLAIKTMAEKLRDAYPNDFDLAQKIHNRNFVTDTFRDLANQVGSRSLLSILAVIRRFRGTFNKHEVYSDYLNGTGKPYGRGKRKQQLQHVM